jgi:hypothetical protein
MTHRRPHRPRLVQPPPSSHEQPASDPHPVLDVAGLIERITAGDLDAVLPLIAPVIGQRLRLLEAANTLSALSRFDIGDRVRINHTVKPSYLHEARGTVTGRAGQQVVVRLDDPVGRFTGEVRCPPQALEPLSAK